MSCRAGHDHRLSKRPDRSVQSKEDGVRNNGVANVHLNDFWDCCDSGEMTSREAMSGSDLQPEGMGASSGAPNPLQLGGAVLAIQVAVGTSVQLNLSCTQIPTGANLRLIGFDEKAQLDACFTAHPRYQLDRCMTSYHVETTLGGPFLTTLGHQRYHVGSEPPGNARHLWSGRHFHIQNRRNRTSQRCHVRITHVTPVFPQVCCNAVGAGLLGPQRSVNRIGIGGTARIAQRGNVIDVDVKAHDRLAREVFPLLPWG